MKCALLLCIFLVAGSVDGQVLVFSKTKEHRHTSIKDGKLALLKLGKENNMVIDTTESAEAFSPSSLKKYKAVVFLNTTGDVLNEEQQAAFEEFINQGGGFLGIHSAADTEYKWPWYGRLVGAYFKNHPKPQRAVLLLDKPFGKANLPARWERMDEWYNYYNVSPEIQVVYWLDETSYEGGEHQNKHPIAWYHKVGRGRAFYMGFGHVEETYTEPFFLSLAMEALTWVGRLK